MSLADHSAPAVDRAPPVSDLVRTAEVGARGPEEPRGGAPGHRGVRRRLGRRAPWWMSASALSIAALVNVPLLYILVRAIGGGWDRFAGSVVSETTFALAGRTLLLVAGTTTLSIAVALPTAWLVARTDLPWRRGWAVLAALPLVFPSYVAAFSLVAVLGPRGFVQGWLAPFGVERLPEIAYGYTGALMALGLFTYPYTYLLLLSALRNLDPSLEESSRSLGYGRWRTFWGVVLPQLRPALFAGTLLVALYTLSDFGAVSIVRFDTFTLSIYNAYGLFDRSIAASLAAVLILLTVSFVLIEGWLARRVRPSRVRPTREARIVRLGGWRWPSLFALGSLVSVAVLIPVGVVVFWGVRALMVGNPLGSSGAAAATGAAALGSLTVSLPAALIAVVLALPIAAYAVRFPSRLSSFAERATNAGYALPGIVVALSLVFLATRLARPLYQTTALLIGAYLVRFLPEALAAVRTSLQAVSPVFEEAARSLGRGGFSVLRSLTLPMIRSGMAAGAGLVFLTSMKELPATLILRPSGFETLATRIWTAAGEGIYSEAALPALALVVVTAFPVYGLIIRPVLAQRDGGRSGKRGQSGKLRVRRGSSVS